MHVESVLQTATGGHQSVPADWVSATALRPLIQDDPCLVWLKLHGHGYGLKKDDDRYSFLSFIGEIGRKFEDRWVREVAPEAKAANGADHDVRGIESLRRTLALMKRRVPVITKAALWWAPFSTYGTADVIVLASWLRKKFPQCVRHIADGPDHYVVLDAKFKTGLDKPSKKKSLRPDSTQVRLYGAMIGHLQGVMPSHSFLITRDHPFDPLPIAVDHELGAPLDAEIADQIKSYKWIARHGARVTPWACPLVAPNWSNAEDAPWTTAKRRIRDEFWPCTPLEVLPGIGQNQAAALKGVGFVSAEELIAGDPDGDVWRGKLPGLGDSKARRLRAILRATKSGRPSAVPLTVVPPQRRVEIMVDFEFLTSCKPDFAAWPDLSGLEMVFMIGCGWVQDGQWQFRRFTAREESLDAEREIWIEFLQFLRGFHAEMNYLGGEDVGEVALFHWSPAELSQCRRAAERLDMPALLTLAWVDLRQSFTAGDIALPGCWGLGLKEVTQSIGELNPGLRVEYPDELGAGLAAMVMGWTAYAGGGDPQNSPEIAIIGEYLEADVMSLFSVLRWLRSTQSNWVSK